jgi:hypothetical protein
MDRFSPTVIAMEAADYSYIPEQLRGNIKRLHDLGAPSSTYAFLCQLVEAVEKGDLLAPTAVAVLDSLEAFLTRRALCGIEPTGLHAVFKGMWTELAKDKGLSVASFKKAIKQRTTVSWPTDEDLERAIRTGDLYNRRICRFVLSEFEREEHGETPEDGFWIEHILPATHSPHWGTLFTEEQHARLRNTFANLIPLTAAMNNNGGQNAFDKKKEAFRNSIFSTARAIAADFDQWTPERMGKRADRLSLWAAGRWPSGA